MFNNRYTNKQRRIVAGEGREVFQALLRFMLPALLMAVSTAAVADVVLTGVAIDGSQSEVDFSLSGESRDEVVGGEIKFGESRFEITHVSVHRLVGAEGSHGQSKEYAVFSSSYTAQTATGKPWVASDSYHQCDQGYNSFLAIYRVSEDNAKKLGQPPFHTLTESTDHSDASVVYCFVSEPDDSK